MNLPTNSSISVTLSQEDLRTVTTAAASATFSADRLWLNGKEEDLAVSKKMAKLFKEMRALRKQYEEEQLVKTDESAVIPLSAFKLHVVTENNFPTAAGLASSAAGYAALVKSLAELYELPQSAGELSILARQGSGSACRSLFGGYVAWQMGEKTDGSDSMAVQIADKKHWPDMKAAILVVSAEKKDTPSTAGMQQTVKTSLLFQERITAVVPKRYEEMKQAILERDFETFAHLTMQDSNQFHACCLDSYPPIFYLNDTSRAAIRTVEEINRVAEKTIAAYTFDAGPNAVVYYLKENEDLVLGSLKFALGHVDGWEDTEDIRAFSNHDFDQRWVQALARGITKVILTAVGGGPQRVSLSLMDKTGYPIA